MSHRTITAQFLWRFHREALGGVSAVTGDPLPEHLEDCRPGVQASHYAMAVGIARVHGAPEP